jgi:virginiamycin B lyase
MVRCLRGALACAVAMLFAAPIAHASLYWLNDADQASTIGRANTDGSAANQSFISGLDVDYTEACGAMAADVGHIYWSNTIAQGFTGIGRAASNGSTADPGYVPSGAQMSCGVAVDGHYIYWADRTGNSIGRANLDGSSPDDSFITGASDPWGVAVDANHIYWSNRATGAIGRANLNGTNPDQTFITGLLSPHGVAVDGSHIYWANDIAGPPEGGSIGRANLDGSSPNNNFIAGADRPHGIAIDAAHIFWANWGNGTIGRANLNGSGATQALITGATAPAGVAVDPGPPVATTGLPSGVTQTAATLTGTVDPERAPITNCHFDYGTTTSYGQTIACVQTISALIGAQPVSAQLGSLSSGTKYYFRLVATTAAGTSTGGAQSFTTGSTPPPPKPVVTSGPAAAVTYKAATLQGTIDPSGSALSACYFRYGTTSAYGSTAPCDAPPSGLFGAQPASVRLTALKASTTYHFQLVATNAGGTTAGSDATFTTSTLPPRPVVETKAPDSIGHDHAELFGSVDPRGTTVTDCHFELGTTTAYGRSIPCDDTPGGGSGAVDTYGTATGLAATSTYHVRLVATNAGGTTYGNDITFDTVALRTYELRVDAIDVNQAVQTNKDYALRALGGAGFQGLSYTGLPLAAGKPTDVRVIADAVQGPDTGVPVNVWLHAYRDGHELPGSPIMPDSPGNWLNPQYWGVYPLPGGAITDPFKFADYKKAIDEIYDNGDEGFEFRLPPNWTDGGTLQLKASLQGPTPDEEWAPPDDWQACDTDYCQGEQSLMLDYIHFVPVHDVTVQTIEMDYTRNGKAITPADPETVFAKARAMLPFGTSNLIIKPYFFKWDFGTGGDPSADGGDDTNGRAINGLQFLTGLLHYEHQLPAGDVMVSVNTGATIDDLAPARGMSNIMTLDGKQLGIAVVDQNRPITSVGHEFVHTLGVPGEPGRGLIPHAGEICQDKNDPNTGKPPMPVPGGEFWPPDFSYTPADDQGKNNGSGIDTSQQDDQGFDRTLGPDAGNTIPSFYDLMSYCYQNIGGTVERDNPDMWISPPNWVRLLNDFSINRASDLTAHRAPVPVSAAAAGPRLNVFGTAVPGGPVRITIVAPAARTGLGMPNGTAGSVLSLALRDRAGHTLAGSPLVVQSNHDDNFNHPSNIVSFSGSVPQLPGAAELQVTDSAGHVLATKARSAHAPAVRVIAPHGGRIAGSARPVTIRYRASDADHDPLQALIEYSANDGRSYKVISYGPATGHVRLPARLFPATRRGRIRITVNDGFNQTAAVSRRFISLGAPPTVEIVSAPTKSVRNDAPVVLSAVAFAPGGQQLPGRALHWRVGGRDLRRGSSISPVGLPPGRRVKVIVSARAGRGPVAIATVLLHVRAQRPRFVTLRIAAVARGRRSVMLVAASTLPATASVEGRHYHVDRRTRRVNVRLRHRLAKSGSIKLVLSAYGQRQPYVITPR